MEQFPSMSYSQLGKSNLNISRIGFGCMSLNYAQPNLKLIIDSALEKGINYFDTADIYENGLNEVALGNALKDKRNQVIIATKVGNQQKQDGNGLDWNPSKAHIINAVEKSLSRLQTDYIDLYQLHGGTIEDNIDETIEAFDLLQQQGKIRHYGISSIRPNVIRAYVERSNIVSVMMQYSLLDRRPEESIIPLLLQNNIGVLARGTIAGGLLAGKTIKPYLNYGQIEVELAANAIKIAVADNNSVAAAAIDFALSNTGVTTAVVGIRKMEQLSDAVFAIKNETDFQSKVQLLKTVIPINYYDQHR